MEDVSAGTDISFINPIHKKYVGNLTSKLARPTLTSPGTVRVKVAIDNINENVNQHSSFLVSSLKIKLESKDLSQKMFYLKALF